MHSSLTNQREENWTTGCVRTFENDGVRVEVSEARLTVSMCLAGMQARREKSLVTLRGMLRERNSSITHVKTFGNKRRTDSLKAAQTRERSGPGSCWSLH